MKYKKLFRVTIIILLIFIGAFVIIPLINGYHIGFINGYSFSLEEPYYLLSVIITGFIAWFSYKIYNRQVDIMENQTMISQCQTQIMKQQNKIAMFDKKYEVYLELLECAKIAELLILAFDTTNKLKRFEDICTLYSIFIKKNIEHKGFIEDEVFETDIEGTLKNREKFLSQMVLLIKSKREYSKKADLLFDVIKSEDIAVLLDKNFFVLIRLFNNDDIECQIDELRCIKESYSEKITNKIELELRL